MIVNVGNGLGMTVPRAQPFVTPNTRGRLQERDIDDCLMKLSRNGVKLVIVILGNLPDIYGKYWWLLTGTLIYRMNVCIFFHGHIFESNHIMVAAQINERNELCISNISTQFVESTFCSLGFRGNEDIYAHLLYQNLKSWVTLESFSRHTLKATSRFFSSRYSWHLILSWILNKQV